jgi:hypothetical protein
LSDFAGHFAQTLRADAPVSDIITRDLGSVSDRILMEQGDIVAPSYKF